MSIARHVRISSHVLFSALLGALVLLTGCDTVDTASPDAPVVVDGKTHVAVGAAALQSYGSSVVVRGGAKYSGVQIESTTNLDVHFEPVRIFDGGELNAELMARQGGYDTVLARLSQRASANGAEVWFEAPSLAGTDVGVQYTFGNTVLHSSTITLDGDGVTAGTTSGDPSSIHTREMPDGTVIVEYDYENALRLDDPATTSFTLPGSEEQIHGVTHVRFVLPPESGFGGETRGIRLAGHNKDDIVIDHSVSSRLELTSFDSRR